MRQLFGGASSGTITTEKGEKTADTERVSQTQQSQVTSWSLTPDNPPEGRTPVWERLTGGVE